MSYQNVYASMGKRNQYSTANSDEGGYTPIDPNQTDPNGGPSYTNPWDNPGSNPAPPPAYGSGATLGGGRGSRSGKPFTEAGATDPGFASPQGGPAGVGGSGGYGFTNLAQYMYANPLGSGAQGSYASVPTGSQASDYTAAGHGFAPNGGYTPGMSAVDNSLNQVYGRTAPQDPPEGGWPQTGAAQSYSNIKSSMSRRGNV